VKSFRPAVLALAAAALLPMLGACSQGSEQVSDKTDTPAAATGGAASASGLAVSNARIVLAPVAGNPAAVYFDLAYSGAPGVSLTEVEVDGAGMTMIHDYAEDGGKMKMVMPDAVPLAANAPVTFAPGGLHVMVMDPGDALKAGGTAKVTLTLSDGAKVTLDAPVRAAGDER